MAVEGAQYVVWRFMFTSKTAFARDVRFPERLYEAQFFQVQ